MDLALKLSECVLFFFQTDNTYYKDVDVFQFSFGLLSETTDEPHRNISSFQSMGNTLSVEIERWQQLGSCPWEAWSGKISLINTISRKYSQSQREVCAPVGFDPMGIVCLVYSSESLKMATNNSCLFSKLPSEIAIASWWRSSKERFRHMFTRKLAQWFTYRRYLKKKTTETVHALKAWGGCCTESRGVSLADV